MARCVFLEQKCIFVDSQGSVCFNDALKGNIVCKYHSRFKCVICGKQATYFCGDISVVKCEKSICDSIKCELLHNYISHPNSRIIGILEKELGVQPAGILIGKMRYKQSGIKELTKAGFIVPSDKGGYIWTTILVDTTIDELTKRLFKEFDIKGRKIIILDRVLMSYIPREVIERLIY